jgi:LmbE family N-acetylglucosaminyl deacetylase
MQERVILVVVAHPDDCELTCAGSVARWSREGDATYLVIASDGARGGKHVGADEAAMVRERRGEQEQAAQRLGMRDVIFLGFPDGELEDGPDLRRALVDVIRRLRPDVAVFMDPMTVIYRNSYVNHRDHRVLGIAMLDALYPQASNAFYFPEQIEAGLQPHKVPEFMLAQSEQPNFWVDVSETLDIRFDALRCHASQMRLWPENGEAVIGQQRELASVLGVEHGARYVEEFRRVVINPLG